jgi:hypothetical protein
MTSRDRRTWAAEQFDQIVRAALRARVAGQVPRPGTRDAILARAAAERDRSFKGAQAALDVPRLSGFRRSAISDTYEGWNARAVTNDMDTRLWLLPDHLRKRLSTA